MAQDTRTVLSEGLGADNYKWVGGLEKILDLAEELFARPGLLDLAAAGIALLDVGFHLSSQWSIQRASGEAVDLFGG